MSGFVPLFATLLFVLLSIQQAAYIIMRLKLGKGKLFLTIQIHLGLLPEQTQYSSAQALDDVLSLVHLIFSDQMQNFEEAEELLTYEVLSFVSLRDILNLVSDVVEVVRYHFGSVCVLQNSVCS